MSLSISNPHAASQNSRIDRGLVVLLELQPYPPQLAINPHNSALKKG
jgi:hypothetical protein